jgi:hypothetical protein
MTRLDLDNVMAPQTDPRIQRFNRSLLTSDTAAAGKQPKSSASGVPGEGPSRASQAHAPATEV